MKSLLLGLLACLCLSCIVTPANLRYEHPPPQHCFDYVHLQDRVASRSCWSELVKCAEWEARMRERPNVYTVVQSCYLQ